MNGEECLSDGVVECLVEYHGWFRNARDLYNNMGNSVSLDRTGLIDETKLMKLIMMLYHTGMVLMKNKIMMVIIGLYFK